jgi:hypothetical protein
MRNAFASLAFVLALPVLTEPASGQGHSTACPDVKATQVDAELQQSGSPKTCGIGLVIFGVGGGIVGEKCYPMQTTVPAHQECKGENNPGTYCAPDGDMPVTSKMCHCGGLVVPIVQIGVPTTCVCGDSSNSGTVEDFKTQDCVNV